MDQAHIFRLVVASPGDVQDERDVLASVVEELNHGIAQERGLRIELSRRPVRTAFTQSIPWVQSRAQQQATANCHLFYPLPTGRQVAASGPLVQPAAVADWWLRP
jgi:hypothetical protein